MAAVSATPVNVTETNGTQPSSLERVADYPIVKQTLVFAHSIIEKSDILSPLYAHATNLSTQIIAQVTPHLPVEKVDGLGHQGLDYLEKHYPIVTAEIGDLEKRVRQPADNVYGVAKVYADGLSSRLSPVTDQVTARITQTQETIKSLQERLSKISAGVPHDIASLQEAVQSLHKEIDSVSQYVSTTLKDLPANAQAVSKPYLEALTESALHIREELSKPDVPLANKATNILNYTKDKLGPLLISIKDLVLKSKVEAQEVVQEAEKTASKAEKKVAASASN